MHIYNMYLFILENVTISLYYEGYLLSFSVPLILFMLLAFLVLEFSPVLVWPVFVAVGWQCADDIFREAVPIGPSWAERCWRPTGLVAGYLVTFCLWVQAQVPMCGECRPEEAILTMQLPWMMHVLIILRGLHWYLLHLTMTGDSVLSACPYMGGDSEFGD